MYLFLMVVHVIVSVLLMLIVLIQPAKGQGLTGAFGTGGGQAVFGVRTGDVMTKVTAVMATLFMITALSLAALTAKQSASIMADSQKSMNALPVVNDSDLKEADMTDSKKAVATATDDLVEKMKNVFKKESAGEATSNEMKEDAGAAVTPETKVNEVVPDSKEKTGVVVTPLAQSDATSEE